MYSIFTYPLAGFSGKRLIYYAVSMGFVKLLIKEYYIATCKSMTLAGKMNFMATENITLYAGTIL